MAAARSWALALCLGMAATPGTARSEPVDDVLEEWLAAVNSGDKAAIRAFYGPRLDDPEAAFAIDNAEATCGFDAVRAEAHSARAMTVLLAERCFPALQRLRIELGPEDGGKLARFELTPLALPLGAANNFTAGLAERLAARDGFAGSLLVASQGEVMLERSWGTLNGPGDAPITADTPMFLASAGKMFTAVAVLQLVQLGKIELDAPMGTYLADYPNAEMARVTVRQLLQHRGGTGDIGILARDEGDNRAAVRSLADIIALNGSRPPAFVPGSKAEYSNYGFVLLGAIVERASGEDYADYVERHIFAPAGMVHAGFPDRDHLQGVATGLTTFLGEEEALVSNRDVLPWRGSPAGGGVASARDMLNFFAALRSGVLLPPDMLRMATTPGDTPWYGMGFVLGGRFYPSWGHGGNSYGMDVAAHFYPKADATFICIATRDMACNRLIFPWVMKIAGPTE